jgi:hypothetical protein
MDPNRIPCPVRVRARRVAARLAGAGVLAAAVGLSGCSSLYLKSEVRQQQAAAATKAWGEVDVAALFAAERENLAKLAAEEAATQRRMAEARLEGYARGVVRPPREGETAAQRSLDEVMLKAARADLLRLVGTREAFAEMSRHEAATAGHRRVAAEHGNALRAMDSPVFDCRTLDAVGGAEAEAVKAFLASLADGARIGAESDLDRLGKACAAIAEVPKPPAAVLTSALGQAQERIARDETTKAAAEARSVGARQAYQRAEKALSAAQAEAAGRPDDATATAKVQAAAATLQAAFSALASLQDAFAKQLVAKESLDSLDAALAAVAAGTVPEGASKAVILAVRAPSILDRWQAANAAAKKPLVLPFLLRANAERIQFGAATAEVQRHDTRIAASQRLREATLAQAIAVRNAINDVERAAAPPHAAVLGEPWTAAIEGPLPADRKQLLVRGAASWIDAMTRLDGERRAAEFARIAIENEAGLAWAEASAAQWANLIGLGVQQLDEFAQGGIDKAVLSDLAKVLGLFWIGHGVNE